MKRQLHPVAPALRNSHLRECLIEANAKKGKLRAQAIKAAMKKESSGKMCYFINRSQKDPRCGSFHTVQRIVEGEVQESTTQGETEEFIREEAEVRFHLATEALIEKTTLIE